MGRTNNPSLINNLHTHMEKGNVFTFVAPNGVEVTAIAVMECDHEDYECYGYHINIRWLCYAQNRLFTIHEILEAHLEWDEETGEEHMGEEQKSYEYGEVVVEYAVIPEYDNILRESK